MIALRSARSRLRPWLCTGVVGALLLVPTRGAAASTPAVVFLGGPAARAAIVNDARDPYFDTLESIEMAAKTGAPLPGTLAEQRAETRRRYQAAVRPFRPEEQQALRAIIAALQPLVRDYPRFARQPWRFVKVADHIEGGLPHTRDDVIVLSEGAAKQLYDLRQRLPTEQALLRVGMVLVHEQTHVLQRLERARFERLYTGTFGYRRVAPILPPADLAAHRVANPDGLSCCWLLARGDQLVWPVLVFSEGSGVRRLPADFRMLAVSVTASADAAGYQVARGADGRSQTEDLLRVPGLTAAFPLTRNLYHPNEVAADLFAQLVLYDGVARAQIRERQRATLDREYQRLRPGFRRVFAR
jgi:hypothetical protein